MNKEEFVKECVKEGLIIYGTTWESNFKRFQELKKYKKIVEEIEERLIPGKANEVPDGTNIGELSTLGFVRLIIKDVKEKYFPKPINKVHQLLMELDELVQETLRLLGG